MEEVVMDIERYIEIVRNEVASGWAGGEYTDEQKELFIKIMKILECRYCRGHIRLKIKAFKYLRDLGDFVGFLLYKPEYMDHRKWQCWRCGMKDIIDVDNELDDKLFDCVFCNNTGYVRYVKKGYEHDGTHMVEKDINYEIKCACGHAVKLEKGE